MKTNQKTYIQELFDNINGGDCVDSAALAQEISEQLLEACDVLFDRLNATYRDVETCDVPQPILNAMLQAGRAIAKARGQSETPKERLEYLRGELRAERISYGELSELASLIPHIAPDDVELLEAAGVPENEESEGQ